MGIYRRIYRAIYPHAWVVVLALGLILAASQAGEEDDPQSVMVGANQRQNKSREPHELSVPFHRPVPGSVRDNDYDNSNSYTEHVEEVLHQGIYNIMAQDCLNAVTQHIGVLTKGTPNYPLYSAIISGISAITLFITLLVLARANRIMEADRRAWLTIESADLVKFTPSGNKATLKAKFSIKNFGDGPARRIVASYCIVRSDSLDFTQKEIGATIRKAGVRTQLNYVVFKDKSIPFELNLMNGVHGEGSNYILLLRLRYKWSSKIGGERHAYWINPDQLGGGTAMADLAETVEIQ
jgi:hypothetical protein